MEQKAEIAALVAIVDRIADCYDRYTNVSAITTIITFSEPRSEVLPDHLFNWMDKELVGLWMYEVEPASEEEVK